MKSVFDRQIGVSDQRQHEGAGGHAVVLVAHPDDESIFFHGTIERSVAAGVEVSVLCATGHFDDAATDAVRLGEFQESCRSLRVRGRTLGLRDRRGARLVMSTLRRRLQAMAGDLTGAVIYTHSPWGDYGHRHHVDVSVVAHEIFGRQVRCLAGPLPRVEQAILSDEEFARKVAHTRRIYGSQAFAHTWCTRVEAFAALDLDVVRFLAEMSRLRVRRGLIPVPTQLPPAIESVARRFIHGFSETASIPAELERIPYPVWSPKIVRLHRRLATALGVQIQPFITP
jgi:LmbE family N-acetylglucosaminyl deacetylase